jgi:reverse gyrase
MSSELMPNIQKRAEEEQSIMRDILFEHADADGRDAIFIDDTLEQDVTILSYAEHLANILSDDVSGEQINVVYRAIHFVHIVTSLHGCNKGLSLESLRAVPDFDIDEAREYMRTIADIYIDQHPTVMGYVDAYMPEIDPSGEYGYLAETVAGIIGSQVEDGLREWTAASMVASWDGIVPDDIGMVD